MELYWQTCTHSSARCYSPSLPHFHYNRIRTCLTQLSGNSAFSRTNLHIHPFCPENHPSPGQASVFSHPIAEQVAVADSRRRHWLPKREGAHEVGRTAGGYCRCNINISHPCNIRKPIISRTLSIETEITD